MIEKITDLTKKSFKNYTGPTEKFKLKNVIFGYNGRGKSSLAIGVRDAYINDGSAEQDKIRFFNKDYVDDNLSLQDPATGTRSKDKIKGVIAHFSAKDVKSVKRIKELQSKLINTKAIEARIQELVFDTRKAVDAIHDRRKGTAAIQKRKKDLDIVEVMRLYARDVDEAKKIEADETRLLKIEGDNIIGEKIELLKTITFQDFTKIINQDMADAENIFSKPYGNISIPSSDIVEWLNRGVALHKDGDKCKFCGGEIAIHDIAAKVEEYNANEKQKDTKVLQTLDAKIAELQNTIKANLDKKANVILSLETDIKIDSSFAYIEEASVGVANARNVIQSKIKNIDKNMTFVAFKGDLQKFNDAIKVLTDIRDTQIDSLETQNHNKDALVKGAIGLEILSDDNIQGKLLDVTTKTGELKTANANNAKFKAEIQTLKQAESATSDFANYINDILTNFNVHLKLLVSDDGKNYIIQHTQTSANLTIGDISEGERNLLALLFFYYELFNDNEQQDFKSDIELIIVDDPISSMDDINKMYILEMMKHILVLGSPQVFMMTHSWDDFGNLCYGLYDKPAKLTIPATPYGFYEIKKDALGNSLVQKTKSNIPPYHHNFAEVYEFSRKPDTTNLDDCDIYHMPNIMRQVLEGFLKFKITKSSPTNDNVKEIGKVLFNKEWAAITEEKRTKLGQLLLVVNVNSHKGTRNPDEVLQAAKFLMTRVEQVDERHFHTHKVAP